MANTEQLTKRSLRFPLDTRNRDKLYNRLGGSNAKPETIAADGAISVETRTSKLNFAGVAALTLEDGIFEGQRKTLLVLAATGNIVVTPATFEDGATLTFDAANEGAELEWHDDGGWTVVMNIGGAVIA